MSLERAAIEGKSPVLENLFVLLTILLEYLEERKPWEKQAELSAKAKYSISPIVNQYREGKVKSRGVTPVKQNLKPFCPQRVRARKGDGVPIEE